MTATSESVTDTTMAASWRLRLSCINTADDQTPVIEIQSRTHRTQSLPRACHQSPATASPSVTAAPITLHAGLCTNGLGFVIEPPHQCSSLLHHLFDSAEAQTGSSRHIEPPLQPSYPVPATIPTAADRKLLSRGSRRRYSCVGRVASTKDRHPEIRRGSRPRRSIESLG